MSVEGIIELVRAAAGGAGLCLFLAASIGADDLARETAVFTAAVRKQVEEHLDATARARGTVVCVGINPGDAPQSPSREFMAGLGRGNTLRRLTECEPRPKGAVESTTLRPAVMVTVGPIEWRADDEAWVTVTYFRTKTQSAIRRYRVVHEDSGWVSLGPIILDAPP
ncbi:MAG TPA: hypothetical protein VGN09_08595 [Vicinamibacteria bacterium]